MADRDPVTRFRTERFGAGVIGLGYVGLPLAVAAVRSGFDTVGYDISPERVEALRSGRSHVEDVSDEQLKQALETGLVVTTDPAELRRCDAIFICVPSPLGRNRQPDMSYIEAAAATVAAHARPGQLVCLESTTYPGTTEEVLVPAVTGAGLVLDRDVWVAFSPERIDPGNPLEATRIPKVVGGVTELSGRVAAAAYGRIFERVHLVSSARAAELTKLLENTYRAVNIALVNELAQLAHELDIDIWEVIDAAATKPFGYQPFYPGPGVGGHCIPLDPQYLAWRARELRFATRFIDLAEQVNVRMPAYVADRVVALLNDHGRPLRGSRVLGIGIAYKPNVGDDRESPASEVLGLLAKRGAAIGVLDPHVPPARVSARGFTPVAADGDLGGWDLAIVLTDHDAIDYAAVARTVPLVFDTRNAFRRRGIRADNVHLL